jgi:chromosome segregation ATPase
MEQFWKLRKGVVEATERVKERYHEEMDKYERLEQVDFKEQQVLRRNRDIDELAEEGAEVVRELELTKTALERQTKALEDSEEHLLLCKTQIEKLKNEIKQKEGELI